MNSGRLYGSNKRGTIISSCRAAESRSGPATQTVRSLARVCGLDFQHHGQCSEAGPAVSARIRKPLTVTSGSVWLLRGKRNLLRDPWGATRRAHHYLGRIYRVFLSRFIGTIFKSKPVTYERGLSGDGL